METDLNWICNDLAQGESLMESEEPSSENGLFIGSMTEFEVRILGWRAITSSENLGEGQL